jgi:glycosyltransferase involved in cell wall biosynthesis
MKILHCTSTLDPAHGGPPAVVLRLASAQAALGHQVAILHGPRAQAHERIAASLRTVPQIDRVTIQDYPTRGEGLSGFLARAEEPALRALVPGADIVHIHEVWSPLALRAAQAARSARVPFVVTVHGMIHPWALAQGAFKKRLVRALWVDALLRDSAFIHALNADEGVFARALGTGASIEIIPNGVFAHEFADLPARGAFRAAHGLGEGPLVLFLSRLHHKKGLDLLADAWPQVLARVPSARLAVAGPDGGDGSAQRFSEAVVRAGLQGSVSLVGPLYERDKLQALVDADVFCLPSRQEGFSIAILEALACATPVAITGECCFPEVAQAPATAPGEPIGAGTITPALNAANVAQGLIRLLTEPARARAMGRNGRQMVLERFTWPSIAERMLEAYERRTKG